MPSRNTVRIDTPDAYYHVYARGASKQPVFREPADQQYFTSLIERYLSEREAFDKSGVPYPNFHDQLELLTFCLMGNHFHMLVHQLEQGSLSLFMKSLMTSYCRYFNFKYKRSGSLFENRYKASRIDSDGYLQHVSRYIHLNPRSWKRYRYSSIGYFRSGGEPSWLNTAPILDNFASRADYIDFVESYEAEHAELDEIKHQLADT